MDGAADLAVVVQHLHLSYGFRKSQQSHILKDLNLSVDAGTIYGLLGSSGCGKTSLLRCIVGRIRPTKGTVKVYNNVPGTKESQIPGSGVGYMPQELCLYEKLTIEETLNFYGSLHRMTKTDIINRIGFLLKFLGLPAGNRLVYQLSGGEKRRVSFAIALLHKPRLLILDEPTVGVDPLLRESIWEHLVDVCLEEHATIIITTHYIDEARQANKVGFLRSGRILIEDNPANLLNRFNLTVLEDVYLKLCMQDDLKENEITINNHENKETILYVNNESYAHPESIPEPTVSSKWYNNWVTTPSPKRIMALVIKDFIQMKRNFILVLFQFLLPAIQIISFCIAVGGEPHSMPVAIFNEDLNMGVNFLKKLDNHFIKQILVDSYQDGVNLVTNGDALAALHMWKNFSDAVFSRLIAEGNVSQKLLHSGSIHIRQDFSDPQLSSFVQRELYKALSVVSEEEFGNPKKMPQIIVNLFEIGDPIYGMKLEESTFTESMASGMILAIVFVSAIGLTSVSFIIEKRLGLAERNTVSGVTTVEMICSFILTQIGIVFIQVCTVLILSFEVFNVHNKGSIPLIVILALLQGLCGMTMGFLISTLCNEERSALMLSVLIFFPCFSLGGILWPISGQMSQFIQKLSLGLPLTLSIDAVKWIMLRGRDMTWLSVWLGFTSVIVWCFVLLVLAAITLRIKEP